MKRVLTGFLAAALLLLSWSLGHLLSWNLGYHAGVLHAITCSSFETGGDPAESPDTDWVLYIELDGQIYASELFIY